MKYLLIIACFLLAGICMLLALLFGALYLDYYLSIDHNSELNKRKELFDTSAKIEKLSGIQLPEFDVVDYKSSGFTFFGDYQDTLVVKYLSVSPDSVCRMLEHSKILHITRDSTGYDYIDNDRDYAIKVTYDRNKNLGEIMLFYVLFYGD